MQKNSLEAKKIRYLEKINVSLLRYHNKEHRILTKQLKAVTKERDKYKKLHARRFSD